MSEKLYENLTVKEEIKQHFWQSIEEMMIAAEDIDVKLAIENYFNEFLSTDADLKDPKAVKYQEAAQKIMQHFIDIRRNELAAMFYNLHRIFTEFRGYSVKEKGPSSDLNRFFDDQEFPEEGVMILNSFAVRNMGKFIELCEEKGIDLSRIRIKETSSFLYAQLFLLSDEKRDAFFEACRKLKPEQLLFIDKNHVNEIQCDEPVAGDFRPRVDATDMSLYKHDVLSTIVFVVKEFRERIDKLVPGGVVFAWQALSKKPGPEEEKDEYEILNARLETSPRGRVMAKLSQMFNFQVLKVLSNFIDKVSVVEKLGDWKDVPVEEVADGQYDMSKNVGKVHFKRV